jgi:hypothetical protein
MVTTVMTSRRRDDGGPTNSDGLGRPAPNSIPNDRQTIILEMRTGGYRQRDNLKAEARGGFTPPALVA